MRTLVTGGHSRLGGEISRGLAKAGHAVAIHCHSGLSALHGVDCAVEQADLRSPEQASALLARCVGFGVDSMVLSASIFKDDKAGSIGQATWADAHAIHYEVPVRMCAQLARLAPGSSSVVISDQNIANPNLDFMSYSLSKSAMAAALPKLALCLAPSRVNMVAPGFALPSAGAWRGRG